MEVVEHLQVTTAQAAMETVEAHRRAFSALGLDQAFKRAIGIVVQPGVEFGNENVVYYDRPAARNLSEVLSRMPQFVFEAHSTDYQPVPALSALVDDGFRVLKVGPGLTFALREALYGLDQIAAFLVNTAQGDTLRGSMEQLMLADPDNWAKYYHGDEQDLRLQRHFSYSDRIRYYWPHPDALAAVDRLLAALGDKVIPETLISQYLCQLYPMVASGKLVPTARNLLIASVQSVVRNYAMVCRP